MNSAPKLSPNNLFRFPPERQQEADYFCIPFPLMPDKGKLFDNMDAITFMSDEAFIYYLPFLMECLLEDPIAYDRLDIIVETKLQNMKAESEALYQSELKTARAQMAEVQKKIWG